MEQVEMDLTEIRAELKKWLNESLTQVEQRLKSELSKSSQNPGLEQRIAQIEKDIQTLSKNDRNLKEMIDKL